MAAARLINCVSLFTSQCTGSRRAIQRRKACSGIEADLNRDHFGFAFKVCQL